MTNKSIATRIKRYIRHIKGSTLEYVLEPYERCLEDIDRLKAEFKGKSDSELKGLSRSLMERACSGEGLDSLLNEAFALVREAVSRVLGMVPYDEQVMGGIVMHQGKVAQMQTGEGKTLTAVFPACLNALQGRGVHILTFNDYLARRDAQWMGPVYEFLGLAARCVQEGMGIRERRLAYKADITYLTAKESGFDFLRDGLSYTRDDIVHRGLHFAVVDEADSILIDEARVPLVIAGILDDEDDDTGPAGLLSRIDSIVENLEEGSDCDFDQYRRSVHLTDRGLEQVEEELSCDDIYAEENMHLLVKINYALHARFLLRRDRDYIVRNGTVELVDEFTGRVADKRRWPEGLHAAVEAREGCATRSGGRVLNSITLQDFLSLYPKLSGMTATAEIAEEEFRHFYSLPIVVIPPHRPSRREDHGDILCWTRDQKGRALMDEIVSVHGTGRPVLVGTRTVEESSKLAEELIRKGVSCDVLNAKNDEMEAEIIAGAGRPGAVTISTNMAGRGTDIRLGGADESGHEDAAGLGGLYVIGTNRHESRRIDDQLRGRAGRQGDPGSSRFFISLEDDLFVRYRLRELLPVGYILHEEDGRIVGRRIRNEIDRIQRIIEGQHLEIKKNLYKYSSVIESQRRVIFSRRSDILLGNLPRHGIITGERAEDLSHDSADGPRAVTDQAVSAGGVGDGYRRAALYSIDKHWSRYLARIDYIREGIHLVRLGGLDPLLEFNKTAIGLFDEMLQDIEEEIGRLSSLFSLKGRDSAGDGLPGTPSSTWTYLVNDDPFEMEGLNFIGNIGLNALAGLLWPLTVLNFLVKKLSGKK